MRCWLAFGDPTCVFLDDSYREPMESPSAALPWEAQMLCWLASGDPMCVWPEDYYRKPMQPPSAALPWEAQMLCWLAFGEHEALERDLTGARILILAGKQTSTVRIFPTESRATPLRRLLWEAQMFCWLAFGEHEAHIRDIKRARILIPT